MTAIRRLFCVIDTSVMEDNKNRKKDMQTKNGGDSEKNDQEMERQIRQAERLLAFRHRRDSLRLHASRVAALAGFHPFANLPEILMLLVYQGRDGQELLRQDAKALGLVFQTEEDILKELANKASAGTAKALETALDVKKGKKVMEDVHKAEQVKQSVVEHAKKSQKLSSKELNVLREGVRSSVDTGYGTHHEDQALDLYEKMTGWEVRERNSQVLSWPFVRAEDVGTTMEDTDSPTVLPLGRPKAIWRAIPVVASTQMEEDTLVESPSAEEASLLGEQEAETAATSTESSDSGEIPVAVSRDAEDEPSIRPFFSISGAVDGIRDELYYPPDRQEPTDDDWSLRPIIVECKHRMKRSFRAPPLYDQIQTTIYCLMYDVEQADLIQVVRKEKVREKRKPVDLFSQEEEQAPTKKPATRITDFFSPEAEAVSIDKEDAANDDVVEDSAVSELKSDQKLAAGGYEADVATAMECDDGETLRDLEGHPEVIAEKAIAALGLKRSESVQVSSGTTEISESDSGGDSKDSRVEIDIYRVSINDPVMQHKYNWQMTVLPRLRSFVDAVYNIRADDTKRYAMLQATSDLLGDMSEAWELLHAECPWLKNCDTAFHRRER